jgi:hypothetical protein
MLAYVRFGEGGYQEFNLASEVPGSIAKKELHMKDIMLTK